MRTRVLAIAMAFVGLSVGAGFASGREVMQFFVHFGVAGIWASVFVAVVMCIGGMVILELGSYYQANEHTAVLDEVAHPWTAKLLDWSVMLTIFSIGFVMFAGAGSNLEQQFGQPKLLGSVILLVLVLIIGQFDVDKVSNIIGAITPGIIVFIVLAAGWCIVNAPSDLSALETKALEIETTLPNAWVAALNYTGFSMIVVVSMSIVIGGYYLNPRVAGLGGLLGGFCFGSLLVLSTLSLFLQVDTGDMVNDALPMLTIVNHINPFLGKLMALAIYGMIFNSAIGMFYALTRRLTSSRPERFRMTYIVVVLVGFAISFFGFKTLVTYVYPILGYIGVLLAVVMVFGWIKDRKKIRKEGKRRIRIKQLMTLKLDPEKDFTPVHERRLKGYVEMSNIEDEELVETVSEKVEEELANDDGTDDDAPAPRVL